MSVPNTNTFALSDVITEINSSMTPQSLDQCFAEANALKFDPVFKGDKTSLLNFRNYGALSAVIQANNDQSAGNIYHQDANWSTAVSTTPPYYSITDIYIEVFSQQIQPPEVDAYDYKNKRGYLYFDVSSIPDTANLVAAQLVMPLLEYYGNSRIIAFVGYQDYTLDYLDYMKYRKVVGSTLYYDPIFTAPNDIVTTGEYYDELYLNMDMSNVNEVSAFEQYAFGNPYFAVVLRNHPNDYSEVAPTLEKNGVRTKKSVDQYNPWVPGIVGFPELRISYTL